MLGLKRGAVALYPHEKAWETEAQATMARLRQILGPVAVEMAHVGSTAIPTIQAKPIVDIAVAVDDFNTLLAYEKQLRAAGQCWHDLFSNQAVKVQSVRAAIQCHHRFL